MKFHISAVFFLLLSSPAFAMDPQDLIEKAFSIARENSVFRHIVPWDKVKHELEKSKPATIKEAIRDIFNVLMPSLKDHHSFLRVPSSYLTNPPTPQTPPENLVSASDGIVTVRVPSFSLGLTGDEMPLAKEWGAKIAARLKDSQDSTTGWLVDLRENEGGNMFPMIYGISSLISLPEDQALFQFVDAEGQDPTDMNLKKILLTFGVKEKHQSISGTKPVAVLIGEKTASSGEFTTLALKASSHIKLFGKPTGGYVTGNSPFPLGEGFYLVLTTCLGKDAQGKVYRPRDSIFPDVDTDDPLTAAIQWLKAPRHE